MSLPTAFYHRLAATYPSIPPASIASAITQEDPSVGVRINYNAFAHSSLKQPFPQRHSSAFEEHSERFIVDRIVHNASISMIAAMDNVIKSHSSISLKKATSLKTLLLDGQEDHLATLESLPIEQQQQPASNHKLTKQQIQQSRRQNKREKLQQKRELRQLAKTGHGDDDNQVSQQQQQDLPLESNQVTDNLIDHNAQGMYAPIPWNDTGAGWFLRQRLLFHLDAFYHLSGTFFSQDPSSQLLAAAIRPVLQMPDSQLFPAHERTILDTCASPGGKSLLLLDDAHQSSLVVSNEYSWKRAEVLLENLQRGGFSNSFVTATSGQDLASIYLALQNVSLLQSLTSLQPHLLANANSDVAGGQISSISSPNHIPLFSTILLDAPCSSSGMFRKKPNGIEQWTKSGISSIVATQRELLQSMSNILSPSMLSVLIYMTCALEAEENTKTINWFTQRANTRFTALAQAAFPPGKAHNAQNTTINTLFDASTPPSAQFPHNTLGPSLGPFHSQQDSVDWFLHQHVETDVSTSTFSINMALEFIQNQLKTIKLLTPTMTTAGIPKMLSKYRKVQDQLTSAAISSSSSPLHQMTSEPLWVSENSYSAAFVPPPTAAASTGKLGFLSRPRFARSGEGMFIAALRRVSIPQFLNEYISRAEKATVSPPHNENNINSLPTPSLTSGAQFIQLDHSIVARLNQTWLDEQTLHNRNLAVIARVSQSSLTISHPTSSTATPPDQSHVSFRTDLFVFPKQHLDHLFLLDLYDHSSLKQRQQPSSSAPIASLLPDFQKHPLVQQAGKPIGQLTLAGFVPDSLFNQSDVLSSNHHILHSLTSALNVPTTSTMFSPSHSLGCDFSLVHPDKRSLTWNLTADQAAQTTFQRTVTLPVQHPFSRAVIQSLSTTQAPPSSSSSSSSSPSSPPIQSQQLDMKSLRTQDEILLSFQPQLPWAQASNNLVMMRVLFATLLAIQNMIPDLTSSQPHPLESTIAMWSSRIQSIYRASIQANPNLASFHQSIDSSISQHWGPILTSFFSAQNPALRHKQPNISIDINHGTEPPTIESLENVQESISTILSLRESRCLLNILLQTIQIDSDSSDNLTITPLPSHLHHLTPEQLFDTQNVTSNHVNLHVKNLFLSLINEFQNSSQSIQLATQNITNPSQTTVDTPQHVYDQAFTSLRGVSLVSRQPSRHDIKSNLHPITPAQSQSPSVFQLGVAEPLLDISSSHSSSSISLSSPSHPLSASSNVIVWNASRPRIDFPLQTLISSVPALHSSNQTKHSLHPRIQSLARASVLNWTQHALLQHGTPSMPFQIDTNQPEQDNLIPSVISSSINNNNNSHHTTFNLALPAFSSVSSTSFALTSTMSHKTAASYFIMMSHKNHSLGWALLPSPVHYPINNIVSSTPHTTSSLDHVEPLATPIIPAEWALHKPQASLVGPFPLDCLQYGIPSAFKPSRPCHHARISAIRPHQQPPNRNIRRVPHRAYHGHSKHNSIYPKRAAPPGRLK